MERCLVVAKARIADTMLGMVLTLISLEIVGPVSVFELGGGIPLITPLLVILRVSQKMWAFSFPQKRHQ